MIEIKIDENGCLTNVSGNVMEITAEVAYAVGDIYLSISSESKECAQFFRRQMQRLMAYESPVWDDYGEEEKP